MTKSQYTAKPKGEVGFPFDSLYINDDFRLKQIGTYLTLRNWADSDNKYIRCKGFLVSSGWGLLQSGDGLKVAEDGNIAVLLPSFTTAQWLALTLADGFLGYDTDLDIYRGYLNGKKIFFGVTDDIEMVSNDQGATPDVDSLHDIQLSNTNPQTITDWVNGYEGQTVRFRFLDGNTTVTHGTNIFLSGRANKNFAVNDMLVLKQRGGNWYQIGGVI